MGKWIYEKWGIDWDGDAWDSGSSSLYQSDNPVWGIYIDGSLTETTVDLPSWGIGGVHIRAIGNDKISYENNAAVDISQTKSKYNSTYWNTRRITINRDELLTYRKKTTLIETIKAEEGTYPDNGIKENYWYVKIKRAFPTLLYKDDQGVVHTIGRAFYKDLDGQVKELTDIKFKG